MIASKAGFIRKSEEIGGEFEVINDHCVDPKFLEISLRKSLQNMNVEMLDVFYLNNYSESQL